MRVVLNELDSATIEGGSARLWRRRRRLARRRLTRAAASARPTMVRLLPGIPVMQTPGQLMGTVMAAPLALA